MIRRSATTTSRKGCWEKLRFGRACPRIERLLGSAPRRAGPTAAAMAGMETCGVALQDGDLVAAEGDRLLDFAGLRRRTVLRWLLACLRKAEWRRLEARRADFRGLPEPDTAATAIAIKAVEGRDRVAALRAVLAGSVVTQVIEASVGWADSLPPLPPRGRGLGPQVLAMPRYGPRPPEGWVSACRSRPWADRPGSLGPRRCARAGGPRLWVPSPTPAGRFPGGRLYGWQRARPHGPAPGPWGLGGGVA